MFQDRVPHASQPHTDNCAGIGGSSAPSVRRSGSIIPGPRRSSELTARSTGAGAGYRSAPSRPVRWW
jgi:hypothetical protein